MSGSSSIAVVGGGVVGATLARLLQRELRGAQVTVLAASLGRDTTSHVAAGLFRPGLSFRGPTEEITKKWIDDSFHHWQELLRSPDAAAAGVMALDAYIFSKDNPHVTRNHLIEDLVPLYRAASAEELETCGGGWRHGALFSTLLVSCERHLPWAYDRIARAGGSVERAEVEALESLAGRYDLVFNCTGLGARRLCADRHLVPMRGQVVKVRAPWLRTALYGDYDTYIIPGFDGVCTLGGVRQYDSYNTGVCRHDAAAIMERCCALEPRLASAEVLGHAVGLRPHRSPVRVEPEVRAGLRVVHCYGHGGYGVTCAPGTAQFAVDIGIDMLKSNIRPKL